MASVLVALMITASAWTRTADAIGGPSDGRELAAGIRILVNHLGYDSRAAKQAVIEAPESAGLTSFALLDAGIRSPAGPAAEFAGNPDAGVRPAFEGTVRKVGPVDGWKGRYFWLADFSAFAGRGRFRLLVRGGEPAGAVGAIRRPPRPPARAVPVGHPVLFQVHALLRGVRPG